MMRNIFFDFHIHTALSPCGDEDMTPNNIVNMALIKELDAIAITDHNTCGNVKAVMEVAKNMPCDLLVLPGMEVETSEEIHVVCLFKELDGALAFEKIIDEKLPKIPNREDIFGRQVYYDAFDEITGFKENLLLTAVDLDIQKIFELVHFHDGIAIPAHIDRTSYSILSNLGFFPKELGIRLVEYSKHVVPTTYMKSNPYLERFSYIQSSDAHYLGDMSERERFLSIDGDVLTPASIIDHLKNM